MSDWGFVYVASNRFMPGLVKIGMTRGSPSKRVEDLSTTSVPGDFDLVYAAESCQCAIDEVEVHKRLRAARVHGSEFFRCTPRCAVALMRDEAIGNEILGCPSLWADQECSGCAACCDLSSDDFLGL